LHDNVIREARFVHVIREAGGLAPTFPSARITSTRGETRTS
jgi:hypothetical protein